MKILSGTASAFELAIAVLGFVSVIFVLHTLARARGEACGSSVRKTEAPLHRSLMSVGVRTHSWCAAALHIMRRFRVVCVCSCAQEASGHGIFVVVNSQTCVTMMKIWCSMCVLSQTRWTAGRNALQQKRFCYVCVRVRRRNVDTVSLL